MEEPDPSADASASAFRALPPPTEISLLLREMVSLSGDFERRLGSVLGIGPTDLAAMQHLMQSGPLPPSELSRRLLISTAAATMLVDRLESAGHAERHPHPADRRKIVVAPNPESVTRAADELMPLIREVGELTTDLTAEETGTISRFLRQVLDVYRRALD
jgi:DNA-binding MarR family transcriptional regulator